MGKLENQATPGQCRTKLKQQLSSSIGWLRANGKSSSLGIRIVLLLSLGKPLSEKHVSSDLAGLQ